MNTTNPKLTTLSFGGGQDSTELLERYIFDADFRSAYAPNDFVAIMSDTGNEHPLTYKHTAAMMRLAKKHGVEFFLLTSSLERTALEMGLSTEELKDLGGVEGFHSESWSDYVGHYERVREIPLLLGKKSCTGNLKISPLHRFLEQYVGEKYGLEAETKSESGRVSVAASEALRTAAERIRTTVAPNGGTTSEEVHTAVADVLTYLSDHVGKVDGRTVAELSQLIGAAARGEIEAPSTTPSRPSPPGKPVPGPSANRAGERP